MQPLPGVRKGPIRNPNSILTKSHRTQIPYSSVQPKGDLPILLSRTLGLLVFFSGLACRELGKRVASLSAQLVYMRVNAVQVMRVTPDL